MLRYYDLIKDMANKFHIRLEMVTLAQTHNISHAAIECKTTRTTVRKL